MTKPAKLVVYGLAAATVLMILDVIIRPQGLAANNGLSYYGDYKASIIPYSLAFFSSAFTYWEAARDFDGKHALNKRLSLAMKIMAGLFIGLLVTPSSFVDPIHTCIGTALFSFQLAVSMWLLFRYMKDWQTAVLAAVMWLSGLGAFYYLQGSHGFLLQTQVIFQFAFAAILVRALNGAKK